MSAKLLAKAISTTEQTRIHQSLKIDSEVDLGFALVANGEHPIAGTVLLISTAEGSIVVCAEDAILT